MENKQKNRSSKEADEIAMILQLADESPTTRLFVGEEGDLETLDEMKSIIAGDIDDPETKYDLYYKGIQKVLRAELPKGSKYKLLRDEIREELAVFLADGKRKVNGVRGADSRMGRLPKMEKAFDMIFMWRGCGAVPSVLYNDLLKQNAITDKAILEEE